MFHFIYEIYISLRSSFYAFLVKSGGGGVGNELSLRFILFLLHGL